MNSSRKVTLIISKCLAEEIRQRTNLSMQGEGKARQVLCLPLPRWPASPACLLKLECCHTVEDQRNPSAAWRRQAKPEMQQRSCKWGATRSPWGQKGGTALVAAVLCQPGQSGTSLLQPGWQRGAWSPVCWSLVSSTGPCQPGVTRTSEYPESSREALSFCQLSGACHGKVVQRHSWRW